LSLPNPYDDISRDGSNKHCGYDYAKSDIADIAEAREKELLAKITELENKVLFTATEYQFDLNQEMAKQAALIAELRGLDWNNLTDANRIDAILDKYEEKP
jgi:hypothetical protein